MAWDDKIKKLPDQNQPFIDMRDTPVRSNELTELGVADITIPQDCAYDLLFAPREPSSTVPQTVFVSVNGIVYSEIDNPANLTGYTFWVNYAAARILVPTADAGKKFTQLEYDNWGTQHRRHFYTDAYESLRNIRTVAQKLFDSLEAFPNFQIKLRAANLTELQTNFPAASYEGADAYIIGEKKAYRSNGVDWLAYEDITTADPVPQITGVSPSDGQVSVALASNVELTFSQNMNGDDLMTQFSLLDVSATPVAGAFRFYDKNGTEVTSGSIKIRKMIFDPTSDLTIANSPYSIQLLTCENILGTQMATSFTSDFSCASDMLPDACTISISAIDGDSADVYVDALGGDYEGSVVYDVYLRDVIAAGSFVLATDPAGVSLTGWTLASPGFLATVKCAKTSNNYEVLVKTRDNSGQTKDSNIVSFTTSGVINAIPTATTIELVSVGDTTATIRLVTASTDTEDGTITIYRGFVDGVDKGQDFTLAQGGTLQFTGLTNGLSHSLTLKAKDSGGALSTASNTVNATPSANASPTVSSLSATGIPSNINYKGAISDAETNNTTGLKIQRRPAGAADWTSGNGMVEVVYESTDGTTPSQVTAFTGASGLDVAGTYSGDYDWRACARDAGSGVYGAWAESLYANGGGIGVYPISLTDSELLHNGFKVRLNGTDATAQEIARAEYRLKTVDASKTDANQVAGASCLVADKTGDYSLSVVQNTPYDQVPSNLTNFVNPLLYILNQATTTEVLNTIEEIIGNRKLAVNIRHYDNRTKDVQVLYWDTADTLYYWDGTAWATTSSFCLTGISYNIKIDLSRATNAYNLKLINADTGAEVYNISVPTTKYSTDADRIVLGDNLVNNQSLNRPDLFNCDYVVKNISLT